MYSYDLPSCILGEGGRAWFHSLIKPNGLLESLQ